MCAKDACPDYRPDPVESIQESGQESGIPARNPGIFCRRGALVRVLILAMHFNEILNGWKSVLAGRPPILSIEITKECPLTCPGCYAYGPDHLGGDSILRQVSDFQGQALVDRVIGLVDQYRR